jgi:cytochrome b
VNVTARIRVWDLPTRIFHWSLAGLVAFSFVTGKIGDPWMSWHLRSGYGILTLLAFRIAWGFAGGRTARFSHFLRGPRIALEYAREALSGRYHPFAGHNPLGGWMVVVMLAALLVQACTGLFADDEIATQGPLAVKVSNAFVSRMSAWHSFNEWLVVGLATVHVAAIALYRWKLRARLAGPMVHGWVPVPPGENWPQPAMGHTGLALALLAFAAAMAYVLVVVYPAT